MKQLLTALVLVTATSGCLTVNGRSLGSLMSGSKASAPNKTTNNTAPAVAAAVVEVPSEILSLDANAPTNPLVTTVKPGAKVLWEAVFKVRCPWSIAPLQPLARLEVKSRSTWAVTSGESRLLVKTPDGACVEPSGDWAIGTYTVFAEVDSKGVKTEAPVLVSNLERRLSVAEAPRFTATAELPFAFEVQAKAQIDSQKAFCGATGTQPVAVVELKTAVVGKFRLLHPSREVALKAVLLSEKPARDACKDVSHDELPAGTWAIFVNGPEGAKAWVSVEPLEKNAYTSKDAWKWSLRQLRPVPEAVPLQDRELTSWYPWFTSRAVEPLFLDAPRALFVTVTADSDPVTPGEPLLLVNYGAEKSTVMRTTGEQVQVRTERLGDVGGAVKLPTTFPEVKPSEEKDYAWQAVAPPAMAPRFESWRALRAKNYDCVDAYMRKHDPSWGKQNYIVIGNTRARALGVADKQCNTAAVDSGWTKLKVDTVAERKNLRAKLASLNTKLK